MSKVKSKSQNLKVLNRVKYAKNEVDVVLGNDEIHLTHLDKMLWLKKGITKKDLAIYYIRNADQILPELESRPITALRCIEGVAGECFYQRHFDEKLPRFIKTVDIWTEDKKSDQQYICINNLATLLWLVNREVIEVHAWLSRIPAVQKPDCIVFDLDPHDGASPTSIALLLKSELNRRKMKSWVKTTGLGGLHVLCPIRRNQSFEQTRALAKEIAEKLSLENPKLITASYRKEDKEGKVLIDYSQNAFGKSIVALGSPRSNPDASISTKISWTQVESSKLENKSVV